MTTQAFAADRRQFLAALAALAATPSVALANNGALQAMVNRYVAEKKVANMVVAIGRKSGAPTFFSAGTLELGAGANAGPDTLYRIYSMTKCVTGCAIMMLVEDGKLTLDTPLSAIFPAYAQMKVLTDPETSLAARPATKQILIRHLVTHTAGLAYASNASAPLAKFYNDVGIAAGRSPPEVEARMPKDLQGFAELTAYAPLAFEPGSKWKYSIGLDIAAAVVEKVSGIAFEDFLAQRLYTPLGMKDTFFTVPADKLARLAANYRFTPTGLTLADPAGAKSDFARKPRFPSGGGGLVSSARDYAKFTAMLLNEGQLGRARVLKTETAKLMMSNIMDPGTMATTTTYGATGYGSGGRVALETTKNGEAPGTYGWAGAATTFANVDRGNGLYAVLMTQVMGWETNPVVHNDLCAAAYAK